MEEWRPVVGFERSYAVSSLGRVKNIDREVRCARGVRRVRERVLALEAHYRGYSRVMMGGSHYFVHRLVANAFLDPAHTTEVVNHKNGDKSDNRVENLEWNTFSENTQHYHRFLRPELVPKIPVDEPFDPADLPF